VDGEFDSRHCFIGRAQEEAQIQRGNPETHGGGATEAMGGQEKQPASGLTKPDSSGNSESVGLCFDCEHSRVIRSDRGSIFYLCRLSATDPRFVKYPRLPVLSCPGYRRTSAGSSSGTKT
jgi:hypothetical protein